jgi:hypothetical protein
LKDKQLLLQLSSQLLPDHEYYAQLAQLNEVALGFQLQILQEWQARKQSAERPHDLAPLGVRQQVLLQILRYPQAVQKSGMSQ